MQYMILRKSDAPPAHARHGQALASASTGVQLQAHETLRPTDHGAQLRFSAGRASVTAGPFDAPGSIDGFAMVEAASRADAMAWAASQVAVEGSGVVLEVRDGGCPGGLRGVPASEATAAAGERYMLLLKASERAETGAVPAADGLARMARRNDEAAAAGVLLMAEGLKTSASASRVTVPPAARGKPFFIDGPFAEAKELLAGFWIIRAASLDAAIDWALDYPFPFRETQDVEVEIRLLNERSTLGRPLAG